MVHALTHKTLLGVLQLKVLLPSSDVVQSPPYNLPFTCIPRLGISRRR